LYHFLDIIAFSKSYRGHVTVTTPISGSIGYCRMDLNSTHIANLKYLRLPPIKIRKASPYLTILILTFEPPCVDLGITHKVHLWKAHCRLPISDN